MEKKVRTTPLELAAILEEVARNLRERGVFSAAGMEVAPGAELELEVEFKEKKGRAELELEIKWRAEGTARPAPSAPSFRELKREMDSLLDLLRGSPEARTVERFGELVEAFAARARPEWRAGIEDLREAEGKLREAVSRGDRAALLAAVEELSRVKKECHRRFR
jgi:amphi-Trp domain-containing protein